MNESNEQRTTLVMKDVRDADGTMWEAVHLSSSNELVIEGHDLGPGVERFFGCGEYEFQRALSSNETSELRKLLGLSGDQDLLSRSPSGSTSPQTLRPFSRLMTSRESFGTGSATDVDRSS